jgi:hypothetical protein
MPFLKKNLFALISALIIILLLAGAGFWYYTTTPMYTVGQISAAAKKGNYEDFSKYIVIDEFFDNIFSEVPTDNAIAASLLPGLKEQYKIEFRKTIEEKKGFQNEPNYDTIKQDGDKFTIDYKNNEVESVMYFKKKDNAWKLYNFKNKNPEAKSNSTSLSSSSSTKSYTELKLNEKFKYKDYTLSIIEVKFIDIIKSDNPYTEDQKPTNKFLRVKFEGENTTDKPFYVSIDTYSKILSPDNKLFSDTYSSFSQLEQVNVPAGYKGCISCETNPGVKAQEYVFFDITDMDLSKTFVIFNDQYKIALK